MDFCQARGIFISELKLSEVEVDEKLWIRIFPSSLKESFIPLNEESREKDSEDGKHKITTVEKAYARLGSWKSFQF